MGPMFFSLKHMGGKSASDTGISGNMLKTEIETNNLQRMESEMQIEYLRRQ